MIKRISLILGLVLVFASGVKANVEASDILTSSTDYQTTSYGVCRKVKDGYIAQITEIM